MSDSPSDNADVGLQTDPSPVDSAPPAESPAADVQPVEQSEAEQQAEFAQIALRVAKETDEKTAQVAPASTEPKAADTADKSTDPKTPEQKAQADEEPEDEGEDRGEGFGKHPRWKSMVAARNEYRTKAESATRELDSVRAPAEQYGLIERYMSENGLSTADVTTGFKIMALMRSDPAAAREALLDQLHGLNQFLGHSLPADLQQQVDEGYTTEELARELVQRRNNEQLLRQQQYQSEQQNQQRQVEQQTQQLRGQMAQAVTSWETQIRQSDPDYAKKEPFIVRELQALRQQYRVETPEHAVQLAQMAYANANKAIRALIPRPEVRPNGAAQLAGGNSAAAKPQPRSFEEACLIAAGLPPS